MILILIILSAGFIGGIAGYNISPIFNKQLLLAGAYFGLFIPFTLEWNSRNVNKKNLIIKMLIFIFLSIFAIILDKGIAPFSFLLER